MRDLLDLHLLEENPIVAPVELNQSGLGWKDTSTEFILPLGGFQMETNVILLLSYNYYRSFLVSNLFLIPPQLKMMPWVNLNSYTNWNWWIQSMKVTPMKKLIPI